MALISHIFVTPMATSSSGLLGKLPNLIALATAPHLGPLPASGEREGPAQREGEGQGYGFIGFIGKSRARQSSNGPSCRRYANA